MDRILHWCHAIYRRHAEYRASDVAGPGLFGVFVESRLSENLLNGSAKLVWRCPNSSVPFRNYRTHVHRRCGIDVRTRIGPVGAINRDGRLFRRLGRHVRSQQTRKSRHTARGKVLEYDRFGRGNPNEEWGRRAFDGLIQKIHFNLIILFLFLADWTSSKVLVWVSPIKKYVFIGF